MPASEVHPPEVTPSQVSVKTVVVVCATVLGVLLLAWTVLHAKFALALILIAALIATALDHAVSFLARHRVPRKAGIAIVMVTGLLLFAGLGLLVVPPMVKQIEQLSADAPQMVDQVRHSSLYTSIDQRVHLEEKLRELRASPGNVASAGVQPAIKAVTAVFAGLGGVVTIAFLVLFMLLFGGTLVHTLVQQTTPERRGRYVRVVEKVYHSVGGYLSGLAMICGVNAVCTTSFLAILGVPFFLPLGILSGFSSLVPLAGNSIAGVLISLVALATGGLWRGVAAAIFFVVYQQFENHVLGPIVYRRTVDLNPLVVVLSLLVFAEIGGVFGAIVAVPIVAAGQVVIKELLAIRREALELPEPVPAPKDGSVDAAEDGRAARAAQLSKRFVRLDSRGELAYFAPALPLGFPDLLLGLEAAEVPEHAADVTAGHCAELGAELLERHRHLVELAGHLRLGGEEEDEEVAHLHPAFEVAVDRREGEPLGLLQGLPRPGDRLLRGGEQLLRVLRLAQLPPALGELVDHRVLRLLRVLADQLRDPRVEPVASGLLEHLRSSGSRS